MTERAPITYREAGVDIDAGDELVERIKPGVRRSMRPEVLGGIGGFGALVEVPLDRYRKPVLVSGTDGVGTKLRLAIDSGRHDTVGIDLVAMCVNDVVVQGAEPLYFPRLFCDRQTRCRRRGAGHRGYRRGLRASGLRAGGRGNGRNARHVPWRGLRSGRILRRHRGKRAHHRRLEDRGGRRGARPALLRTAFQRLFPDPENPAGERSRRREQGGRHCAHRPADGADPHLRQTASRVAEPGDRAWTFAHHGRRTCSTTFRA